MYKSRRGQQSLLDDVGSFGGVKLDRDNEWVRLSEIIPWDDLEIEYASAFGEAAIGNLAKPARMALGTLLIKKHYKFSNADTINELQMNPYLQFFIGLTEFLHKAPFDARSITNFQKRVSPETLSKMNAYAVDVLRRKTKLASRDNNAGINDSAAAVKKPDNAGIGARQISMDLNPGITPEFNPDSCDTLVIIGGATKNGGLIFAKNSDRDVTEAQPLELFPAKKYIGGEKLRCTHITIDQAPATYRVIGSRPWWIWGFEHGINEHGVVIGNEAAWSRIPEEETDGLIGMDLLRLGLERGKTADEALGVITDLLERHGQGGSCSYGGGGSYNNLFLIADLRDAWILETVNRRWIAKKVDDYGCISNMYGIGPEYDKSSKDIIEYAVSKGLHTEVLQFNFAKSYTLIKPGATSGFARANRMRGLLRDNAGRIDVRYVKSIMRDHFEGEVIAPRWSPAEACNPTICMHGAAPNPGHTAASVIVEMHPGAPAELAFTYWGCMCPPCLSFYIPYFNTGYLPPRLSAGETNKYTGNSLWWNSYRLVLAAEANYEKYHEKVRMAGDVLEDDFHREAELAYQKACELHGRGAAREAADLLNTFTDKCVDKVAAEIDKLTAEIEADLERNPGQVYRTEYVKTIKKLVEMP